MSEARTVAGFSFEPHRCFACGELNEHGLHLELHADEAGCWTETVLPERFQGWDSVAHGGILATLLDEVMAWSVIGRGTWGVTARLGITFRKPARVGVRLRAEGRVVEDRRRLYRTEGRVVDAATGEVLAEGDGTFVAVPAGELERLKARYGLRAAGDDEPSGPTARARTAGVRTETRGEVAHQSDPAARQPVGGRA